MATGRHDSRVTTRRAPGSCPSGIPALVTATAPTPKLVTGGKLNLAGVPRHGCRLIYDRLCGVPATQADRPSVSLCKKLLIPSKQPSSFYPPSFPEPK